MEALILALSVSAASYAYFSFLGSVLLRLFFSSEDSREWAAVLSPWAGLAAAGVFFSYTVCFGWPIHRSAWGLLAAAAAATILPVRGLSWLRWELPQWKIRAVCLAVLLLGTGLFSIPAVLRAEKGPFISIGNVDPWSYVVAAERFAEGDVRRFVSGFREGPGWKPLLMTDNNSMIQIAYNPRWLPMETLAAVSSLTRIGPERIYATLTFGFLMLLPPMAWLFARRGLGLSPAAAGLGALLCAVNCHIVYIAQQAFFPQILATGFWIGTLALLPSCFREGRVRAERLALVALLAAGIGMSYLEIFPYFAASAFLYLAWQAATRRISGKVALASGASLAVLWVLFAPYQTDRLRFLIDFHGNGGRTGWDVTRGGYYLLPFQLGLHLSHPVFPEPSVALEWLLGIPLLWLAAKGWRQANDKGLVLSVLAPLAGVGILMYAKDFNYGYYKNFTYGYFLAPVLVAAGLCALWDSPGTPKPVRIAAAVLALVLTAVPAVKCGEITVFAWRSGHYVPADLRRLESLDSDSRVDDIFIEDFSEWEGLWMTYYLRGKRLGMPGEPGYLTNPEVAGDLSEARFRYAIVPKGEHFLGGFDRRGAAAALLETERYGVYRLNPAPARPGPSVRLEPGFPAVEGDGHEQWCWIGGQDAFLLSSPSPLRCRLSLDLESPTDRPVEVSLDGRAVGSFRSGARSVHVLELSLPKGLSRLTLQTLPPKKDRDIRIFKIRTGEKRA